MSNSNYQKSYYEKNKDVLREKRRLYRERNKDKCATREAEWRASNRDKVKSQPSYNRVYPSRVKRRHECAEFNQAVRLHYGCVNPDCKWNGSYSVEMLDYHHIDGDKNKNVSQIYTLPALCREINKCCVLCSNCHRQVTWGKLDAKLFHKCSVKDGKIE